MNEAPPVGPQQSDEPEPRGGVPGWVKMAGVLAALTAGIVWLLAGSGATEAFVYSKLVHEVVVDPEAFAGRELRVEGDLRQGSVRFREEPCEWRFVLEKAEHEMPVRFPQCVVPDTFRDDFGISVTVQGQLGADGTFLANQVVPRCPSKYEMQEKLEAGEDVPHAM
jgi:cytochrome c-type biogenesis protein CcmE